MVHLHLRTSKNQTIISGFILSVLPLFGSVCYAQKTGDATAKGTCIVANTGSNARINQTCIAVDPELFAQFKDIANQTRRNGALLNSVLAQLRAMAKQFRDGTIQVNNAPGGFATSGGTLINPTINNRNPLPEIEVSSPTQTRAPAWPTKYADKSGERGDRQRKERILQSRICR